MSQWYCTVSGTKYGPMELEVLRQWMGEARLQPSDMVWTEGMANWQPATSVPDLQGAAPAAGIAPAMPARATPQAYYPAVLPNAPGAVTSLVCGIVGVALPCVGLILGIVAVQQSRKAREEIALNPGRYGGGGMATAGLVLGIIGIVWGAFWVIYLIFVFSVMGAAFRHI